MGLQDLYRVLVLLCPSVDLAQGRLYLPLGILTVPRRHRFEQLYIAKSACSVQGTVLHSITGVLYNYDVDENSSVRYKANNIHGVIWL
jgi:hypothetical protein